MATEAIHKYLMQQNRPYSINDLVENLNKEFSKTVLQKSLDELVENEKILEKIYGKQKVYCIIQEQDSNSSQIKSEISEIDRTISKLQETLTSTENELKSADAELKMYTSSLTTEQAIEKQEKLTEEVEKLKLKLAKLEKNTVKISAETRLKIETEHLKNMKEYRKRKRICMDILNGILESYPKKKTDLFEEIGVETDEDVGCNLPK